MKKTVPSARIPLATYRLQFNRWFKFTEAMNIIGYLHDLGITDIYASPYFKARKDSLHGYDIVDPTVLNPEVGTPEEYEKFTEELGRYGMGQILDIVPNHMCADSDNPWWMDVLENGPCAISAGFFDIDWSHADDKLRRRLLLPVLADQYGRVLEKQELRLSVEEGAFYVNYEQFRLPLQPNTYIFILEHRIDVLSEASAADDPQLAELMSIITALNHLPRPTECDNERVAERYREKEIIKKRLARLCAESAQINTFVYENIQAFNGNKGDPASFDLLDRLLNEQVWRLSYWRVASEEINFRRFFDINHIAAIHMEDEHVFETTHKLILDLVKTDKVTGLRIDHPDGLYNPLEYFRRLQLSCSVRKASGLHCAITDQSSNDLTEELFYVIIEKILTKGEKMPDEWPVFGTTGYAFLNSLNGIFIDSKNSKFFDRLYSQFIKTRINFPDLVYEKKKLVMHVAMSGEVRTLGHFLNYISERNRHTRDFTFYNLAKSIVETIAFFPVYRTYISSPDINERDRQYIEYAIGKAKRNNPAINASIFDFLKDVLLLKLPDGADEAYRREWLDFIMRFQQFTGPVMAKGLEDTAFYIYNRLISLNEVGGSPDRFGTPLEAFHGQNIERMKLWPHSLNASSTHDTKRGEDVRARINVLSEIPELWRNFLQRASQENRKRKAVVDGQPVPDRNEEYLLYQTLLGAWPSRMPGGDGHKIFGNRIKEYMLKAVREAKVHTSWINPDSSYEEALMSFIEKIMNEHPQNKFMNEFERLQLMITSPGMLNSLSQTLLKIASPGVPDFFQGSETCDLNLVDPDNRRIVDYQSRIRMLSDLKQTENRIGPKELARELCRSPLNGRIKLYLTYKALNCRKQNRQVFEKGEYIPLEAGGPKMEHICAFARRTEHKTIIVIAPRFFVSLAAGQDVPPLGDSVWKDSYLKIPSDKTYQTYTNVFTAEIVKCSIKEDDVIIYIHQAISTFPVALLISVSDD